MNFIRYIAALCEPRDMIGQVKRKPKQAKQCLVCDKSHTHNNSYCSAKCCKDQREQP